MGGIGMRRTLLAAALLVAGSAAVAQPPPFEPLDEPLTPAIARQCFEEARALAEADGGRLWGVKLSAPILLVDPKTRDVIGSQADREGLLTRQDAVYIGKLPAEETIAGTATHWAGVTWVMLPWPLPKEKQERCHMFAHETWHCCQHQLGLPASNPPNRHLDTKDGRIWLQLEWRALQAALQKAGKERGRAVADALTFRAYRRSLFPKAAEEERGLEMHEGLAEYTGVRLSRDSDAAAAARALRNVERSGKWPTFVFSFAYVSGPLYGLLLDDAQPDWRKGLTPEHDLGRMLGQALKISLPDDLAGAARKRAAPYGAEELMAAETERENARQRHRSDYRRRFVEGPVLVIPIRSMQFQFDPRDIQPLDDLGKVYPKMRMTDAWGILEVESGGALIAADWSKVTVPAPKDPTARPLVGDGWTLELKDGWDVRSGKRKGDYVVVRTP
jgi:hypothetical protein